MGFLSFGGNVKNKKFDYIPMHYDPAVEDLKTRMSKYGNADITDAELAKARIKGGFRLKARGNKEALKKGKRQANLRLIYILVGLIVGTAVFMRSNSFSDFLDRILN